MRHEYLSLIAKYQRKELDANEFVDAVLALPELPVPYGWANSFRSLLREVRKNPKEFVSWLKQSLPAFINELETSPEEQEMARKIRDLWNADGYFVPRESELFRTAKKSEWRGVPDGTSDVFVAFIIDPDNSLSTLSRVKRYTAGDDLTPHEAPQGGISHVVLVPADFTWILHDLHNGDDEVFRDYFTRV